MAVFYYYEGVKPAAADAIPERWASPIEIIIGYKIMSTPRKDTIS